MRTNKKAAILGALLAGAILATACGGDDKAATTTTAKSSSSASSESSASSASVASTTASGGSATLDTSLKGTCPDKIVVQTDWHFEAEHSATFQLLGDGYTPDANKKSVTGPLVASGNKDTGIKIEIREGGPAIGFEQLSATMYKDDSITMGFVSTDDAVQHVKDLPTVAVMAPLEKNPQIIMWDPATYPDVKEIKDLAAKNVTIRYFKGAVYIEYLLKQGIVKQSQLDGTYDGKPAVFVTSGGKIAQQGFASAEPYTYQFDIKEWAKPVKYQLIHDTGLQIYSQALSVRKDKLEALKPCLTKLVPIFQQAAVDYLKDPAKVNKAVVDLNAKFNDGWIYSQGLADFSAKAQKEQGLVSNGPDQTLGNFDLTRVANVITSLKGLPGITIPDGVKPEDVVTNQFINSAIGLK